MEQDQATMAAIKSARKEAMVVGERLAADAGVKILDVSFSTVVYEREGRKFHVVVHDMTDSAP